jgi:nitric oxide reductase NorD protein
LRARLFARLQGPSMAAAPAYGPARDTPPAATAKETPVPVPNDDAPAYDEFDVTSGTWRTEAVRVVETDAPLGGPEMWERIAHARAGEIKRVRARFAARRDESRWRHAQLDGNELDMGAVIAAVADRAAGMTPDPRVHARWERARDPLAVLVLADLSGSMAGDPLALQNEALVLVAEGLVALGAPHAVYGFGNTDPSRCALQRIKGFDAPWDLTARKRLGGLRAAGASRLGAYVRHAAATLARRPEPRKLLLLLSDGHPEDRDGYRGVRGERDTALAVGEARRRGVQVHCTSLDPRAEADRYLTAIFGRGHFVRVSRPERLPERLTDALLARVPGR